MVRVGVRENKRNFGLYSPIEGGAFDSIDSPHFFPTVTRRSVNGVTNRAGESGDPRARTSRE